MSSPNRNYPQPSCLFFIIFLLTACQANQIKLLAQLSPSKNPRVLELAEGVSFKASNAKISILRAGTHWSEFGTIEQGTVYKPIDQILIVNSFNVHEGYIVVRASQIVGYYLPVEGTFVESKPTSIKFLNETETNDEIQTN